MGIFLGGLLIHQFRPGPKLLTLLITIVEIFGYMGIFSAIFLGCPASQLSGTKQDEM
jgi:hypothetical protein